MTHTFRFLADRSDAGAWTIRPEEWTHLTKVLRLGEGRLIELADGQGRWAQARLESKDRLPSERLTILEEHEVPSSHRQLSVFLAALEHGEVDEVICPLSELGVNELVIYVPQGCEAKRIGEKQLKRWQRLAESSIKQCKRPYVMTVRIVPQLTPDHLSNFDAVIDASLEESAVMWRDLKLPTECANVCLHVSNEAGQSTREILSGHPRYLRISLGPQVLRAKTAVIALGSLASLDWLHRNGDPKASINVKIPAP